MNRILEGVRVADFSQVLAGPTATRLLAEMGADVIKIEAPPSGESSRTLPFIRHGRSGYFIQQNRGKRSLCVSLKTDEGRELVRRVVAASDVVVENFAPGVIERLGFGYDEIRTYHPSVVMCSISAFGRSGPLASKPGYDGVAQAYSGVMHMNGEPDRAPALLLVSPGDVMTGVHAMAGICAALFHRERTGEGQFIELSLLGSYMSMHEINVQAVSGSSGTLDPIRAGSHHYAVCPYGIFTVDDGYVLVAVVTDAQWRQLCMALDRPELGEDSRYASNARRCERQDEVNQLITTWMMGRRREEVVSLLDAQRVPAAPVLSVVEAVEHPHHRAVGAVRRVPDRVWGEIDLPGMPLTFSSAPTPLELEAPFLGEHNASVLTELADCSLEDVRRLRAVGVIHDEGLTEPSP